MSLHVNLNAHWKKRSFPGSRDLNRSDKGLMSFIRTATDKPQKQLKALSVPHNFIFLYPVIWMKYNFYQGTYLLYNHPIHVCKNIKSMMKNGLRFPCIVNGQISLITITKFVHFKEKFCVGHKTFTSLLPLTLCRSYLNPYCLGRKTVFFSVGI
jgi:hypothetical protein